MFDIGFSELLVIAVVALIVIGPERLPKVARTAGHMLGRLQRYVNDVKADINREMELDELRKVQSTFQDAARSIEDSVRSVEQSVSKVESEIRAEAAALESPAAEAAAAPAPEVPAVSAPAEAAPSQSKA
ncbi:MAG: Sec-independent protein translocase protein TatB [Burkholderiales bacterium]|jgi:sec-independent protein translocase protein TatB|nr:Sec-independent protein translocase protein TatB [Burkholderiales bacterium]